LKGKTGGRKYHFSDFAVRKSLFDRILFRKKVPMTQKLIFIVAFLTVFLFLINLLTKLSFPPYSTRLFVKSYFNNC